MVLTQLAPRGTPGTSYGSFAGKAAAPLPADPTEPTSVLGVARVLRAPGRLVVAPTDLAAAFPHGGTELGAVRGATLTPLDEPYNVEFEGLGDIGDVLEPGHRLRFNVTVRGWDDDVLRLLFPDHYEAGAVTSHALFSIPGTRGVGTSDLPHGVELLFVPDDTVHAPCCLMHLAVPDWQDGAQFVWQRGDELTMPLAFELLQDDSGRIFQVGRLEDLTL